MYTTTLNHLKISIGKTWNMSRSGLLNRHTISQWVNILQHFVFTLLWKREMLTWAGKLNRTSNGEHVGIGAYGSNV
jgi:hypothetical protein